MNERMRQFYVRRGYRKRLIALLSFPPLSPELRQVLREMGEYIDNQATSGENTRHNTLSKGT